ncbi:MAG: shikimate dehydrogenase family protein [Culicoidibacterales bacterium]
MKQFALFGYQIQYSLSPIIHKKIMEYLGVEGTYEIVDQKQFIRIDCQQFSGCNVTIPHKAKGIELATELDEHVQVIQAANTLVCKGEQIVAYNTDWLGFLRSINQSDWRNKRILIIGAGGAARAVYYGLQQLQTKITVANRTLDNCHFVGTADRVISLLQAEIEVAAYDYVVQATNQDFDWLKQAQYYYDLRYTVDTCDQNGLAMLIHQAILAQEYFWDCEIAEYQQLAIQIQEEIKNELNRKTKSFFTCEGTNN